MIIVGITGTNGAGKGTIVQYLVQQKGFVHFSVRDFIIREISERGLPVKRETMIQVANELRAAHSPSYIVDELYREAARTGKNCIIESIRTPGEVISLRQKGNFVLFSVDASPEIRYQRIQQRASETDLTDFETFLRNEQTELTSDDPTRQNLVECMKMADFHFRNDSTIADLYQQLEEVLSKPPFQ